MRGSAAIPVLGACLWKEWRDHRAVVLGMVFTVPLLLAVMGLSLPRAFDHEGFAGFAAVACLALFVVSVSADLVPGEARRGHRSFLERLPGGLGAAFRGKLVFFAAGSVLFAAYGYLAGATTCRLVAGIWPPLVLGSTLACIAAVVALWTFAVSCALPRGVLSVPSVAALGLLLALPLLLCWRFDPWGGPEAWERWESAALWAVGGILAAWAAFRRNGFLRAGRACLVVGAVCAMPYWADAAYEAYLWRFDSEVAIVEGFLGEGGRYAFLNRRRMGRPWAYDWNYRTVPLPPVIVDLRTGAVREVEGAAWLCRTPWPRGSPQRYVTLARERTRAGLHGFETFDARTATPARPADGELRAARRATTPWRLGDGRRLWWFDGRLETGAEEASATTLAEGWKDWSGALGLGVGLRDLYDPVRGRLYSRADLGLAAGLLIWIRPGRWLVGRGPVPDLLDPETKARGPAALQAGDRIDAVLDDGRLVVRREGGTVFLDPETGATTELPLAPDARIDEPAHRSLARTPDGRRVLAVWDQAGGAFARFEADSSRFALTARVAPYAMLLGCPSDDEAIVTSPEAIYRLRFGSDEKEEIWRVR